MEQTFGEMRVRADFNASRNDNVANLKNGFARLIDIVDAIPSDTGEVQRLKSIAFTQLETACMFAVKAATTKQP